MFERLTDRARQVIQLSQEEARSLSHNYIGTEHLLAGLLLSEGAAARCLREFDISIDGLRNEIEEIIGQGQQSPTGHIPFTPRSKTVLEFSLKEALKYGHNYIGTEHILLGIIREGEGVAAIVLTKMGAHLLPLRESVIGKLGPPVMRPDPRAHAEWLAITAKEQ